MNVSKFHGFQRSQIQGRTPASAWPRTRRILCTWYKVKKKRGAVAAMGAVMVKSWGHPGFDMLMVPILAGFGDKHDKLPMEDQQRPTVVDPQYTP